MECRIAVLCTIYIMNDYGATGDRFIKDSRDSQLNIEFWIVVSSIYICWCFFTVFVGTMGVCANLYASNRQEREILWNFLKVTGNNRKLDRNIYKFI